MLIAGRVIVETSSFFTSITCACLVNELLHPRIRGVFSALFTFTLMVGAIVGSWLTFGIVQWQSSWSWRLPILLQMIGPVILFPLSLLCPESPRWLVKNGQREEAHDILAKYHANGDRDDELVKNELTQIVTSIEKEEREQMSWKSFISTPGNRRRTILVILVTTAPVTTGLTIVAAYMVPTLRMVNITSPTHLSGPRSATHGFDFYICHARVLFHSYGASGGVFVFTPPASCDCLRRRAVSVRIRSELCVARFSQRYIPPEILPFSAARLKGWTLGNTIQAICASFNTFVNPIALEAIG
ncbi:hypothetical protein MPER_05539, partial [Moniliophthora perniciosa FA553]